MFKICKECKSKRPTANKKYDLCQACNKKRLDRNKLRHAQKIDTASEPKKTRKKLKIKSVSKKERINKKRLLKAYQEIDKDRNHICEGCGQRNMLSHSHLIPQSNKKFQDDRENIVFHCMERDFPDAFGKLGCHQRWESGQWKKITTLNNHKSHLKFIEKNDPTKFLMILQTKE